MSSETAVRVQVNAHDPNRKGNAVRGTIFLDAADIMQFALGQPPKGEPMDYLAPKAPPDLADWKDPRVGWGLIIAESLGNLPGPLKRLVAARSAPVFHYRPGSAHRYSILRDNARHTDVDITGAARGTGVGELPYYLLIYGGPRDVPWRLQYVLNANRCVGRLPLEGEALENYVSALEQNFTDSPADTYRTVTWSADHGADDITRLMRTQVAYRVHRDLAADTEIGAQAEFLDGAMDVEAGSAARFLHAIRTHRPGLIVTTSHGQTGPASDAQMMQRMLGVPVDQTFHALDVNALTTGWEPGGAVWYCHACCSAGADAPSAFESLFAATDDVGRVLREVAAIGPCVAPLPVALLGAKRPLGAFIGHVEPTFDWTLQNPANGQPLTTGLTRALYPNLYQRSPRTTVGHAFREWYLRLGSLAGAWENARQTFDAGDRRTDVLLYYQLAARDVQSTVILGDPAVMLPLRSPA